MYFTKDRVITHIDLVLENCEVIRVKSNYVKGLKVSKITDSMRLYHTPLLHVRQECSMFKIILNKDANTIASYITAWSPCVLPFDRIMERKDMTAFYLCFQNEDYDDIKICVPWKDNLCATNEYQTSELTASGDLIISITDTDTDIGRD